MASGFIILEDGRCFSTRWTGYDEIIRIAVRELTLIEDGIPLANWLAEQAPKEVDQEGVIECGWGFHPPNSDDVVNRTLDIRSLSPKSRELFWKALQKGCNKLLTLGKPYSFLTAERLPPLLTMHKKCRQGKPPLELSNWWKLAPPCDEQNGPYWETDE